jgi:hypothetical protein
MIKLWEKPLGFSPLPAPNQGVADDLFLLFLLHPPQPPQRFLPIPLPLRLWLRQHLSVPSGQKLRLRLHLQWQLSLPLRDWGTLHLGPPAPTSHGFPC